MLENTLRALVSLEYPHDTWVLDEGDDREVRSLCARLGALHFSRKHLKQFQTRAGAFESGSKYGNYNAWLHTIGFERYDIISAFDPDHVPQSGFLSAALGYFNDSEVGYVQFPQGYYNQSASFIARGAWEESRGFYSIVQRVNQGLGSPAVIGCHNTHRVTALREVGGFAAHAADDLLITLQYHAHGWKGVYVPKILAQGLVPVDWHGYIVQQRRWARSLLDIKLRLLWQMSGGWPFRHRLFSFVQGLTYLQDGIVGLAASVLFPVMLVTGFGQAAFSRLNTFNAAAVVAVFVISELCFHRYFLDAARGAGVQWRAAIVRFAKWPYTLLALWDVIRTRSFPYSLTRKAGNGRRYVVFWPHAAIALGIAAAWFTGSGLDRIRYPAVHVWSGAAILACLGLVASGFWSYPPPYDAAWRKAPLGKAAGSGSDEVAADACGSTGSAPAGCNPPIGR